MGALGPEGTTISEANKRRFCLELGEEGKNGRKGPEINFPFFSVSSIGLMIRTTNAFQH